MKKKEPKPKLFGPDIFQWGRGLPRERVGGKKFDMSLEAREIKLFGRYIPGFCRDIPGAPEKFEKKKFVFNSRPLESSDDSFLNRFCNQIACGPRSCLEIPQGPRSIVNSASRGGNRQIHNGSWTRLRFDKPVRRPHVKRAFSRVARLQNEIAPQSF